MTPHEMYIVSILAIKPVSSVSSLINALYDLYEQMHKMPKYGFTVESNGRIKSPAIKDMLRNLQKEGVLDVDLSVTPKGWSEIGTDTKLPVKTVYYIMNKYESFI
jgi:hypothetical protein